jgi:tetratricopeptide (TPR) repeat protein
MDYAKIGLVEKAIEAHEKAAMLDPSFPQPYCNLGRIYLTAFRGKEEDAAALFRKALSLKPDFVDAWVNLAAASIRSGKYPEGAQAAQRGVALAPDRPDAHYNLAVALFKGGDRQGATSELEIVKRLDPKMGNALEYYLYYLATSSR